MKIIGIDSSGLVAGVAIWEDGVIRAEYSTNFKKTHSQTLLPMLDEICRMTELDIKDIDAIAVAAGPGSYTGLRIGSATAKGIGFAVGKPIVEIPTLEGLAYNFWGTDRLICPLMDARRGQVYTGIFESDCSSSRLNVILEQSAIKIDEIIDKLNELQRPVVFLGDGVTVNRDFIEKNAKFEFAYAPAHMSMQRAAGVAALGAVYFAEGRYVDAADHVPVYLRKSQAENEGPQSFLI